MYKVTYKNAGEKNIYFRVDLCRESIYNVDNRYIDELHIKGGTQDEDDIQNI